MRPFGSVYFSNGMRIDGAVDAGAACCEASAAIGVNSGAIVSRTRGARRLI